MRRIICWWFGCAPDYDAMPYAPTIPCSRCDAPDTSYADRVGDTRHAQMMNAIRSFVACWWPAKCVVCSKRFGPHDRCVNDDIPF